jgi:hypothetical protein
LYRTHPTEGAEIEAEGVVDHTDSQLVVARSASPKALLVDDPSRFKGGGCDHDSEYSGPRVGWLRKFKAVNRPPDLSQVEHLAGSTGDLGCPEI